jgi:hypothetical protein
MDYRKRGTWGVPEGTSQGARVVRDDSNILILKPYDDVEKTIFLLCQARRDAWAGTFGGRLSRAGSRPNIHPVILEHHANRAE